MSHDCWRCLKCWTENHSRLKHCSKCGAVQTFIHITPKDDACKHDFKGYREFEDGNGGEAVCTKCGMGAMEWTLRVGP